VNTARRCTHLLAVGATALAIGSAAPMAAAETNTEPAPAPAEVKRSMPPGKTDVIKVMGTVVPGA